MRREKVREKQHTWKGSVPLASASSRCTQGSHVPETASRRGGYFVVICANSSQKGNQVTIKRCRSTVHESQCVLSDAKSKVASKRDPHAEGVGIALLFFHSHHLPPQSNGALRPSSTSSEHTVHACAPARMGRPTIMKLPKSEMQVTCLGPHHFAGA